MGSCLSAQRGSSLDSAVKRSLSSPSPMGTPTVTSPRPAAGEVLVAAAWKPVGVPIVSRRTLTFSDFGSKEDSFFDSQAWLESDCEDEFFSVKGDFTPSRAILQSTMASLLAHLKGSQPFSGTKHWVPFLDQPQLVVKRNYLNFSRRVSEVANLSTATVNLPITPQTRHGGFLVHLGLSSVHSSKRAAGGGSKIIEEKHVTPFPDCLLRLVSCGGSSKRRREMTPAIAIHG
ncbi:uncharacterized protein At3g27210 [Eucalyptus grandis]|uniref:uncharacterized protein At3g27210 n=1 Tax=Eucalyptus grandis TaxID=71139 RepID=UPI00192EC827|nr:uncharacterized protein At3g27210 [Eucalyptus grandis]